MDAFGYIRVSKDQQANDGISLPAQSDLASQFARLYNHKIIETFSDTDTCRNTNRPGFQEMIRQLMLGRAKMVIVYRLDRLFGNTLEAIKYADLFKRWGVELVSISERIDTSTPMGECVYTIIAAMGQLRVREIGERTKMSLAWLREQGCKYSSVPYGYQEIATDRFRFGKPTFRLVSDPAEQAIITRMMQLRSKEGWSYDRIARLLNAEAVPTKKAHQQYRQRQGLRAGKSATHSGLWYSSTVRDIIMRTISGDPSNADPANSLSSPDPQTPLDES